MVSTLGSFGRGEGKHGVDLFDSVARCDARQTVEYTSLLLLVVVALERPQPLATTSILSKLTMQACLGGDFDLIPRADESRLG